MTGMASGWQLVQILFLCDQSLAHCTTTTMPIWDAVPSREMCVNQRKDFLKDWYLARGESIVCTKPPRRWLTQENVDGRTGKP